MPDDTRAALNEHLVRYGGDFADLLIDQRQRPAVDDRLAAPSWISPPAR